MALYVFSIPKWPLLSWNISIIMVLSDFRKITSLSSWLRLIQFNFLASSLYKIFLTMGFPAIYSSDQGREFVNSVMSSLIEKTNAVHRISTAYHPQTNGLVERFNQMSWTSYGPFHDFSILDPFLDDFLALKSKTLSPFFTLSDFEWHKTKRKLIKSLGQIT
jgi:hypothetical protein